MVVLIKKAKIVRTTGIVLDYDNQVNIGIDDFQLMYNIV